MSQIEQPIRTIAAQLNAPAEDWEVRCNALKQLGTLASTLEPSLSSQFCTSLEKIQVCLVNFNNLVLGTIDSDYF